MNIEKQKDVANIIYDRLRLADPHCILAGGAPRDWYFGKEAFSYLIKKAKKFGYTDCQIAAFAYEVQEKIAEMPETDEEELDQLFEELF